MRLLPTYAHGVLAPGDSRTLHRIYTQASNLIGCRIEIDAEIERRIASVVLFAYADALATTGTGGGRRSDHRLPLRRQAHGQDLPEACTDLRRAD